MTDGTRARKSWWVAAATILNMLGVFAVASALVRFNSITLMLSVGVGGALLSASWGIYAFNVLSDLRRRRIL